MEKIQQIFNTENKGNIFSRLLYIIIASPALFLLVNDYPYFGIFSILILLLLGIVFLFFRGTITKGHADILLILIIIYFYFIISYFISNQTVANFFSYDFFRNDGNFFFAYIPFFALAVPYFNYEKVLRIYFIFLFLSFSIFAIIGIIGLVTKNYNLGFIYNSAEGAIFVAFNKTHNATGSVYMAASLAALAFLLKVEKKQKFLYGSVFIFCLIGLAITQSRGSLIGFVAGSVVMFWFYFRSIKKFLLSILGIIIIVSPIIYVSKAYIRFLQIFDTSTEQIGSRLSLWKEAFIFINQSPIFGVGFGRFNDVMFDRGIVRFVNLPGIIGFFTEPISDFSPSNAHNAYLQFFSETGFIGLFLLLLFWIICLLKILRAFNRTSSNFSKSVFLACLGSISALFVMSLTENYFSATTIMMCLSVTVSLSIGLDWQEKRKADTEGFTSIKEHV